MADLFPTQDFAPLELRSGLTLLGGFAGLLPFKGELAKILACSPLRFMETPGGLTMKVPLSNCGPKGWVSDQQGYRYQSQDPKTQAPWPAMPRKWLNFAQEAAELGGFPDFEPDACLINRYRPGASLSAHQDLDELNLGEPIVSVSLGLPARFLIYGSKKEGKAESLRLFHGDVLVIGGASRQVFHGVAPLEPGIHEDLGPCRINLSFRSSGKTAKARLNASPNQSTQER